MKDPIRAEIKRVLVGRAVLADDGRLTAVPAGTFMKTPIGIGDGADAVRIFGVMRRIRRYETKDGKTRVMAAAQKSMQNIGRALALNEQPKAIACLIRYVLTRPAVLVFTWEDGTPTLTAWTGRGLTGWLSLRRAIKAFESGLPDSMTAIELKASAEEKKARKKEKEEKKRQKTEKKAEKKAEKQAGKSKKPKEEPPASDPQESETQTTAEKTPEDAQE